MTVSFKTIGASIGLFFSGVAIVGAVEAPKANAFGMCHTEQDANGRIEFCLTNLATTYGGFDTIKWTGFYGGETVRETTNVACINGQVKDWNSRGSVDQDVVDAFAEGYCEGRGTTGRG